MCRRGPAEAESQAPGGATKQSAEEAEELKAGEAEESEEGKDAAAAKYLIKVTGYSKEDCTELIRMEKVPGVSTIQAYHRAVNELNRSTGRKQCTGQLRSLGQQQVLAQTADQAQVQVLGQESLCTVQSSQQRWKQVRSAQKTSGKPGGTNAKCREPKR